MPIKQLSICNQGYSFSEVIIAMVILSIVALFTGTILSTSTKLHITSYATDDAYSIGNEIIEELQQKDLAINSSGNITRKRNNIEYSTSWLLTKPLNEPTLAKVTVNWYQGNLIKSINLSGYVQCELCISDSINSHSPSSPTINNSTLSKDPSSNIVDVGTNVATISSSDNDENDFITFSFNESGTPDSYKDNSKFKITGSSLITQENLSVGTYNISIKAIDCAKHESIANVVINVPDNILPPEVFPQKYEIPENSSAGFHVGTINANRAEKYTIESTIFKIENPESPTISVISPTPTLNFEGIKKFTFTTTVYNDNDNNSATTIDTVVLTNVNEAPNNIVFTHNSVKEDDPSGTTVGLMSTSDPDIPHGDSHRYYLEINIGNTTLSEDNDLFQIPNPDAGILTTGNNPISAGEYNITITSEDLEGLSIQKAFTITIEPAASFCNNIAEWNSQTTYATNHLAVKSGIAYKAKSAMSKWNYYEPPNSAYWDYIQFCETPNCGDYSLWNSSTRYDYTQAGVTVSYNSKLYINIKAEWGNIGQAPSTSTAYWQYLSDCN